MPIPSPAEFRDRTKKHSQVRELMGQLAENVADKTWTQNAVKGVESKVFSKTGKNLFNKIDIVAGEQYSTSALKIIVSSVYRRSGFVPVTAGNKTVRLDQV